MLVRGFAIDAGTIVGGRFRVESLLGKGGFGAVFAAYDLKLGRDVALKVLFPGIVTPESVSRFHREAQIAQRLTGPHVVRIYDLGTTADGTPFIAWERVPGRPLSDFTTRPLGYARSIRIARQVLGALEEAHALGIVHRDIKPANVMISSFAGEADFVKVLDFGIAAAAGPDTLTRKGQGMGTPAYMAPEQILNRPSDARADLFSLGVVLLEMLSGARLFPEDNALKVAAFHASPVPVAIPDAIARSAAGAVLARALEKDPARRFDSAAEMARALDALPPHEELPVVVPLAVAGPAGSPRARSALLLAGAAALALAVVAAIALVGMNGPRRSPVRTSDADDDRKSAPAKPASPPPAPKTESGFDGAFSVHHRSVADLVAGIEKAGYTEAKRTFEPDYQLSIAHLRVTFHDPSGRIATLDCYQQGASNLLTGIPDDRPLSLDGRAAATLAIVDASGAPRVDDARTILSGMVPLRTL